MLVGSQAGNAPNDIAGLFFLLAAIAFLVNGAATAGRPPRQRARSARVQVRRRPSAPGHPAVEPPDRRLPATRRLRGSAPARSSSAALAAGLGIGTKITLLAALGVLTLGIAVLAGRRNWLRALGIWLGGMLITSGFWYGRNLVHAANPFPQIDKHRPDQPPRARPGAALYPREPHSLSEYYNDPDVWQDFFFPVLDDRLGPLWPVILAFVAFGLVWPP